MEMWLIDLMKLLTIKYFANGMFGICNKGAYWRFESIDKD